MTGEKREDREKFSRNVGPEREYILSFSSFYKAAYAQDILEDSGFRGTLKKLPPELVRSCGTGIYMRTDTIERVRTILQSKQIVPVGIYLILRDDETENYHGGTGILQQNKQENKQGGFQGKRYAKVK